MDAKRPGRGRTTAASDWATVEIRTTIHAPLPFVFRWCTDYSAEDGRLAQERYTRRLLERGPRQVLFEDLEETPRGWVWKRTHVDLHPPDHWHAESEGNYRYYRLDYRLQARPDGSTELLLRGERRATALGGRNPSRARLQRELRALWARLGRALEREYRGTLRRSGARGPRGSSRVERPA